MRKVPAVDGPTPSPSIKRIAIDGADLHYLEQGQGTPVVFIHGGVSDHRIWENQRAVISRRYRFVALDQRYFGTSPWADDGAHFSSVTHVADLAAFIQALRLGPSYLVGQSYGAVIALGTAIEHPESVRGLFLNEPPLPSSLTDVDDQKVVEEERRELAAIAAMAKSGNAMEATRLFVDWVNGQEGSFAALSPREQTMHLDNARTLPLQMRPSATAPLTCAQLGRIRVPVTLTQGDATRPYFRVIVRAVYACILGSQLMTIAGAQHGAPRQAPVQFNEALFEFLARH